MGSTHRAQTDRRLRPLEQPEVRVLMKRLVQEAARRDGHDAEWRRQILRETAFAREWQRQLDRLWTLCRNARGGPELLDAYRRQVSCLWTLGGEPLERATVPEGVSPPRYVLDAFRIDPEVEREVHRTLSAIVALVEATPGGADCVHAIERAEASWQNHANGGEPLPLPKGRHREVLLSRAHADVLRLRGERNEASYLEPARFPAQVGGHGERKRPTRPTGCLVDYDPEDACRVEFRAWSWHDISLLAVRLSDGAHVDERGAALGRAWNAAGGHPDDAAAVVKHEYVREYCAAWRVFSDGGNARRFTKLHIGAPVSHPPVWISPLRTSPLK